MGIITRLYIFKQGGTMLKIFDAKDLMIKKIKNEYVFVANIEINSDVLNFPIPVMNDILKSKIYDVLKKNCHKYIYFKIKVVNSATKEDIEDLYDYIESAITDCCCTKIIIADRQERLGLYGIPKIKMKAANILKWIKEESVIDGLNLEVSKQGSFWQKRMVK